MRTSYKPITLLPPNLSTRLQGTCWVNCGIQPSRDFFIAMITASSDLVKFFVSLIRSLTWSNNVLQWCLIKVFGLAMAGGLFLSKRFGLSGVLFRWMIFKIPWVLSTDIDVRRAVRAYYLWHCRLMMRRRRQGASRWTKPPRRDSSPLLSPRSTKFGDTSFCTIQMHVAADSS